MKIQSALLALSLLVLLSCSSPPPVETEVQIPRPRAVNTTPQIFTFESDGNGFNTKNFFFDNGEEVVVFDTQFTPALARQSLEYLRTKTQNPISYVIITHPSPDKFNGIEVFREAGAKIVASKLTAESMQEVHAYKRNYFVNITKTIAEDVYPKLPKVDITFDKGYVISLRNGATIQLEELKKPGASSNQTIARVPSLNSIFVGDLIHNNVHAWLEGGIVKGKPIPNLKSWVQILEGLLKTYQKKNPMTYGGRGEVKVLNMVVPEQIAYLKKAETIVRNYIQSLKDKRSELRSEKAPEHYLALQAQFEDEFPDYGLGYLIQYGIYGLVNSMIQN